MFSSPTTIEQLTYRIQISDSGYPIFEGSTCFPFSYIGFETFNVSFQPGLHRRTRGSAYLFSLAVEFSLQRVNIFLVGLRSILNRIKQRCSYNLDFVLRC